MEELLSVSGVRCKHISILGVFDYLVESDNTPLHPELSDKLRTTVVSFAGNLSKSAFISDLDKVTIANGYFALYGASLPNSVVSSSRLSYQGSFQPNDLTNLQGDWGLVWDGDSIESCSGAIGNYLRINAPHKASLYLAKGMPIIVWEDSAIALYVKQRNIGIVVKSLHDIAPTIDRLTVDELTQIYSSVQSFKEDLRQGAMLRSCLSH